MKTSTLETFIEGLAVKAHRLADNCEGGLECVHLQEVVSMRENLELLEKKLRKSRTTKMPPLRLSALDIDRTDVSEGCTRLSPCKLDSCEWCDTDE